MFNNKVSGTATRSALSMSFVNLRSLRNMLMQIPPLHRVCKLRVALFPEPGTSNVFQVVTLQFHEESKLRIHVDMLELTPLPSLSVSRVIRPPERALQSLTETYDK
eukprot:3900764-Amphidinium_carterae.1